MSWNARNSAFASSVVLPSTAAVISDAAALLLAQRRDFHPPQDFRAKAVRQQPARLALAHAATAEIEQRARIERAYGGAVRALHVVGVDLELRLAVCVRLG